MSASEFSTETFESYHATNSVLRNRIKSIEDKRKRHITKKDLSDTVRYLKDFGIHIDQDDIPDYEMLGDLLRWKTSVVKKWSDYETEN